METKHFCIFGQMTDRLFLEKYMRIFISEQAKNVKWYAEITETNNVK
ncbi:hypothetical protein [Sporosarcina sp. G11-34]|nr:hypothetical protein [Sporosarcina sp. G11-34]MCZ2258576.1 hypothetical protein [Sporosarcina sp. G11-34]